MNYLKANETENKLPKIDENESISNYGGDNLSSAFENSIENIEESTNTGKRSSSVLVNSLHDEEKETGKEIKKRTFHGRKKYFFFLYFQPAVLNVNWPDKLPDNLKK